MKVTLKTLGRAVSGEPQNFQCNGTLKGKWTDRVGSGMESPEEHKVFQALLDNGKAFVVYSYETPVAAFKDGVWYVTSSKYTSSTSRHLSTLRQAVGQYETIV